MKLLLLEDSELIVKSLEYMLKNEGYEVDAAYRAASALKFMENNIYDLAILDVSLPDGNGFDVCKELKNLRPDTPVLFLTAIDEEDEVVRGFDLGADDYVVKPFRNRELLRRITNILRRYNKADREIVIGRIKLDLAANRVYAADDDGNYEEIVLTALEYKILSLLFQNRGKVVRREVILDNIWDYAGNVVNDNTLTVYVKRIREKLGEDTIKTVKGLGYMADKQ